VIDDTGDNGRWSMVVDGGGGSNSRWSENEKMTYPVTARFKWGEWRETGHAVTAARIRIVGRNKESELWEGDGRE
jgi:hypothetical protein